MQFLATRASARPLWAGCWSSLHPEPRMRQWSWQRDAAGEHELAGVTAPAQADTTGSSATAQRRSAIGSVYALRGAGRNNFR